jgi:hypothetical protein
MEQIEPDALRYQRSAVAVTLRERDNLLKYWTKQNQARRGVARRRDVAEFVAGHTYNWLGQTRGRIELPYVGWSQFSGRRSKVDPVGPDSNGNIGTGIDKQLWAIRVGSKNYEQLAREFRKSAGFKILFAELNKIDSAIGQAGRLTDERVLLHALID